MTLKEVTITVDSRETRAGTAQRLRQIAGVTVVDEQMECGDYAVMGTALGIERKAANDFAISIMDGRLFGQIELCRARFDKAVVLVEGDLKAIRSQISPEALDGALSYIALLSGVQLLFSTDINHTVALLHRMALHVTHGLGYEIALRGDKPKELGSIRQYLVEGLPGVGPSGAKTLLAAFQTPRAVFAASESELKKVKGVGPKTIARIQEVLG